MKIGLVLSGGGARGFAHLGVIKAINELGLSPDMISGTSAGSLVGAFIAAGYSPDFVLETILKLGIRSQLKFAFNRFGLFSLEKVEKLFHDYIPHNSFEALKIPLVVCATDIVRGETVYFDSGDLAKPVLASCCIPGIFEPVIYNGHTLIDGGVMNNLPLEPLEGKCDLLIGVNVTPIEKTLPIKSAKDVMMKCLFLSIGQQAKDKLDRLDIAIEPSEIAKYDGLSLSKAKELYNLGYESAKAELEGKLSHIL